MDDLFAFNDNLNEEEKRYLREGLESEDQLAVFDLLQKDSLTKGDRDAIKKVAMELLDKLMQRQAADRPLARRPRAGAGEGRDHQAPVRQLAIGRIRR